jgi:hypothetical protein
VHLCARGLCWKILVLMYVCMYGLLLAPLRLYNGNTTSIVLNGYSCYS